MNTSIGALVAAIGDLQKEIKHLDCACTPKERMSGHLIDCNISDVRAAAHDVGILLEKAVVRGKCERCGKSTIHWGKRANKWCCNSCRVTAFQKARREERKRQIKRQRQDDNL